MNITTYPARTVITGQSTLAGTPYTDVKVTPDGGICTNQNILVNAGCSSTANLAVGATFTGTIDTNIFASGIQVLLTSDQNCTVFIDQSGDGINYDVSDEYPYYAAVGNFGITTMCVGVFYRVRVTNVGVATTTTFRLQTISVPFVSPLPRTLSQAGHLQTAIYAIQDHNQFEVQNTPHGEMRIAQNYLLVGEDFTAGLDPNFYTSSLGTGGTITTDGQITINTGTTANNTVTLQSVRTARYVSGQGNTFRSITRIPDAGVANNTRRLGPFTTNDGAFFEITGTTFSLNVRKSGVTTNIPNGTFNGHHGGWHIADLPHIHTYEIRWTTQFVYFFLDGHLIHTHWAETAPWTATVHLPVRFENFNTGGSTTNVAMEVRNGIIFRSGPAATQPTRSFQQRAGTDVTATVKTGPGTIHGVILSGITNNSVVNIYDNTAASGTLIFTSGSLTANGLPFTLDFKGIAFSVGLTINITTANLNVLTMFE